ncbi:hypothetical protein [Corallococcus sicarius]|uniref:Lipoprotein n=1 Tax=Corallococcus sicarius TaxID=2316726 RepID=A0A3A8N2E5_9BACT|nr:hypothetical protein [Corallococcus sicarius]RKH38658.1 hypothetical protein D7X12_25735 [Corallococcus sicarius]
MKKQLMAVLMGVGLLAGCGGVEADVDAPVDLATREDELPACGHQSYERVFYSEPEKINEVGWWICGCDSNTAWVYGKTTAYSTTFGATACPQW